MNDVERYRICLQCTRESHSRNKDFWVEKIEEDILYENKWRNPYYMGVVDVLCNGCPYMLEHVVLNSSPVEEMELGEMP